MGRVYERFKIPTNLAGKLEGRSSYARLGLSVHCTGDFVNPGWEGFMPLQLFNAGPYPLRIAPYYPVCQLMLVTLSTVPDRSYGDVDLRSKYSNDDGGPSLWWRDEQVKVLQTRLGALNITELIQQQLVSLMRQESPAVIERFQHDLDRMRVSDVHSKEQVLDRFVNRETRRRRRDRVLVWLPGAFLAGAIGALAAPGWVLIGLASAFIISLVPAFAALIRTESGYFTADAVKVGSNHLNEAS